MTPTRVFQALSGSTVDTRSGIRDGLAWRLAPPQTMRAAGLTPDPWQARILTTRPARLLVLCCRQAGKSTVVAALALYVAAMSRSLVLIVTPTQRQSSEMLLKVRSFAQAAPVQASQDSALALSLRGGGRVLALPGTPTSVRGYTAVLAIVDEAAQVTDDTYRALRPTLAASGGSLVALSTPHGRRGWFYRAWSGDYGDDGEHELEAEQWSRTEVTHHDCPRISGAFLAGERAELGPEMFRQEYECEFVRSAEGVFDPELIRAASPDPHAPETWAQRLWRESLGDDD